MTAAWWPRRNPRARTRCCSRKSPPTRRPTPPCRYAKETAEAANRAKSRYVVGLSHELRTPLNAVLGYAQILERDETIPAPRQSAIKVIKRSADHLSGLIDGLLDISKIEAGRLQVYSNEINIQDFLDQIVDMFRPQAQAKGLDLRARALSRPAAICAHRREAPAPDPRQPALQRHQVHRRGQRHASMSAIAARSRPSPSPIPAAASPRRICPHLRALPARRGRTASARCPGLGLGPDHHPAC